MKCTAGWRHSWDPWNEPFEAPIKRFRIADGAVASVDGVELRQRRRCIICGLVQERRVMLEER